VKSLLMIAVAASAFVIWQLVGSILVASF